MTFASGIKRRAVDDVVVHDLLTVRDVDGVVHTLEKKSPAQAAELFGRACCTVCRPPNSDNYRR
ncbi:hypothetical protein AURDEDRAFT_159290 [Auricularia subglabra TFB-10046 SS5]|nr:hypothetical protein AURDEDRAFT_159290 [Auricularia subglabra TFB-10046 SS5]